VTEETVTDRRRDPDEDRERWTMTVSGESMSSIYSSVGSALDSTTGTVKVTTLDCSGMPLGDVAVTLEPAAQHSLSSATAVVADRAWVSTSRLPV
jgi:hypothetical protein